MDTTINFSAPCDGTKRGYAEFQPICASSPKSSKRSFLTASVHDSCSLDLNTATFNETVYDEIERGMKFPSRKLQEQTSIGPAPSPMYLDEVIRNLRKFAKVCRKKKKRKHRTPPGPSCKLKYLKNVGKMDRDVLTRKQYINLLATPKPNYGRDPCRPPKHDQCKMFKTEMCSPRILQLAVPKKRKVFETWKSYQYILSIDFIERLKEILRSDRNLETSYARKYFKQLKRKAKRKKDLARKKRKKRLERKKDRWLRHQIKRTAKIIACYVKSRPNYTLNYKQIMISDALYHQANLMMKIPRLNRNCPCNPYKRTLLDILDKMAVWTDTTMKYVDLRYTESEEELLRLPSVRALEAGEGMEEEYEETEELEESEEEESAGIELGEMEDLSEYTKVEETETDRGDQSISFLEIQTEVTISEAEEGGGEEDETDVCGGVRGIGTLEHDTLQFLISLLERKESLFEDKVDTTAFGAVTKGFLLEKLRALADEELTEFIKERQAVLEKRMIEWVKQVAPDELNEKLCQTIKASAAFLARCFGKELLAGLISEEEIISKMEEIAEAEGEGEEEEAPKTEEEGGVVEVAEEEAGSVEEKGEEEAGSVEEKAEEEAGSVEEKAEEEAGSIEEQAEEEEEKHVDVAERTFEEEGMDITLTEEFFQTEIEEDLFIIEELEEGEQVGAYPRRPFGVKEKEKGREFRRESDRGLGRESDRELERRFRRESDRGFGREYGRGEEEEGEEDFRKPCMTELERRRRERRVPTTISCHRASETFQHSPDTMCCLHLKIWATWLYEVANNAHTWTKWIVQISQEVRHFAAIVRGDVIDKRTGKPKVLYKKDWREFVSKVDKMIVSWRQYSQDVKRVSDSVIRNFKGKHVVCCPKCLEDNNIIDAALVHGITQQLADSMMTAQYWRNWLDDIMLQTCKLLTVQVPDVCTDTDSIYSDMMDTISEMGSFLSGRSSGSFWEIEEIQLKKGKGKCRKKGKRKGKPKSEAKGQDKGKGKDKKKGKS